MIAMANMAIQMPLFHIRILPPSRGPMGIRLNSARNELSDASITKTRMTRNIGSSRKYGLSFMVMTAAIPMAARTMLTIGPAMLILPFFSMSAYPRM